MAASASSSPYDAGNRSAATNTSVTQFPEHESLSLDYHFYHSVRSLTPSGSLNADYDENEPSVEDEDWFVGDGQPEHDGDSPGGDRHVRSLPPGDPSNNYSWTPAGQATSENEEMSQMVRGTPRDLRHNAHQIHGRGSSGSDLVQQKPMGKKQALQQRLASAVLAHPYPLRHYCMDAYATALHLSVEYQKQSVASRTPRRLSLKRLRPSSPEGRELADFFLHGNDSRHPQKNPPMELIQEFIGAIESNPVFHAPLSVMMELTESSCALSVDAAVASGHIGAFAAHGCFLLLCDVTGAVIDAVPRVNPFRVFEVVVSAQRNAMGKTGDVLVSGIQSVATGVGSVSNAAINRLSRQGLALAGGVVGGSRSGGLSHTGGMGSGGFGKARKDTSAENLFESKLFQRLQKVENVSRLVAYSEKKGEEAFSKHAKKRAQRIMHYQVSFRPFTATIQPSSPKRSGRIKHVVSFELSPDERGEGQHTDGDGDNDSLSSESLCSSGSIFMRTPTSFPPTPTSRMYYFERGSRLTENVVFLARDQLRVERGVSHRNEQTRAMSKALIDGRRLAVWDATDAGNDIALSCGQHIATKVGNALYCSARSMIPVMRNSCVYFEISVSPSRTMDDPNIATPVSMTALSVGLSTLEMPLDTLVGAWNGSVGLCSTGQLLHAGQWFSPVNAHANSYGSNCTVGCLVYLDDNAVHDTLEGTNIVADVTFNINGNVVPPFTPGGAMAHHGQDEETLPSENEGEPTLSLVVAKAHELFPTVTLHSPGSCVMCRFSAEDMLAHSRSEIGARSGVVVYTVDGSVVLGQYEENSASASFSAAAFDSM